MSVDVWEAMGTFVSIRIPDRFSEFRTDALEGVRRVIDSLEQQYSLYITDSPISQLARGEVSLSDMSEEFRDTYARAIEWRNTTAGAFTPHRSDGVIDLSGIVKADAIAAGGAVLRAHGVESFSLNFGGDILVAGDADEWPVAIGHPTQTLDTVATAMLNSTWCAIATSGTGDRGEHIWRSVTHGPTIIGATVISHDIVESDVWATAIISGGPESASLAGGAGCAVLYFTDDLVMHANDLMRNLLMEVTEPVATKH